LVGRSGGTAERGRRSDEFFAGLTVKEVGPPQQIAQSVLLPSLAGKIEFSRSPSIGLITRLDQGT